MIEFNKVANPLTYSIIAFLSKARGTDLIKPVYTGIYIEVNEGRLVALDGHRLHMIEFKEPEEFKCSFPTLTENNIHEILHMKNTFYFKNTIEGIYPNYRGAIPDYKGLDTKYTNIKTIKTMEGRGAYPINETVGFISYFAGVPLDPYLVKNVISTKGLCYAWDLYKDKTEDMSPVVLSGETNTIKCLAVLMPISLKRINNE